MSRERELLRICLPALESHTQEYGWPEIVGALPEIRALLDEPQCESDAAYAITQIDDQPQGEPEDLTSPMGQERFLAALSKRGHCPRCDSPAPHLHPAMQHEGEVQPCSHEFHRTVTEQNTPERIREAQGEPIPSCFDCGGERVAVDLGTHKVAYCPKCARSSDCLNEPSDDWQNDLQMMAVRRFQQAAMETM